MVRHYKRKRKTLYSRENVLKAVEEVKFKRMSSYQASEQFGVPKATIYAHVIGTRGFEILKIAIQDLDLSSTSDRIYNLDETSFCQDPSKSKVVGNIGHRCTITTSSPGRTNTSVLLPANANGDKIPPLTIFQGKYLWNEWMYKNKNVKTPYAVSKKGWMETNIFEKYFKDVFVPAIGSERPVLLINDGHSTHADLSIIEYAISERITILKLPFLSKVKR